jgi:hypothetical protein
MPKRAAECSLAPAPTPKKAKTPEFAHLDLAIDFQRLCVAWAAEAGESDGYWSFWGERWPLWTIPQIVSTLNVARLRQQCAAVGGDLAVRRVKDITFEQALKTQESACVCARERARLLSPITCPRPSRIQWWMTIKKPEIRE